MSLRTKTLMAVLAVCLLLFMFVYTISSTIIGQSFRDLEEQSARQDMERISNTLADEIEALNRTNSDYAAWDDSYAFVDGALPDYVETNLSDETFASNHFSLVMFVNKQRKVIFAKAFNLNTNQVETIPTILESLVPPSDALLNLPTLESSVTGVLMLPNGPMMITARPIITSAFTGPANGTLIIGRMLDDRAIARLAETTRLQLTINRIDTDTLSPAVAALRASLTADQPVVVSLLNDQQLVTAGLGNDIAGKPALLLQITVAREVYNRGQSAIRYFVLALVTAGLAIAATGTLLLDYFVLRRLTRLGDSAGAVGASGDISARITVEGRDEIGVLARNINTMLTDIEASQTQLHASEMRFHQLVSVAPEPIIVHNGVVVRYCNPAGAALLGQATADACVGMRLSQFTLHISSLAHTNRQDSKPEWCEGQFFRANGEEVDIEYLAVALEYEHDEMTLLIVRDITIRKQTELALQRAKDLADEANRAKSQFLATMSHELRTPLTAILGYSELLEMEAKRSFAHVLPDLAKIRQSGNHLLALINDVLDLSKIEAGQMTIYPETFSIAAVLDEVITTVTPLANKNSNQIELQVSPDIVPMYTDLVKVRQIALNVVNNACKFTHHGQVTITADMLADKLILQVADTGIGISPEYMNRIFSEFQQADSSSTRHYGGTGLGLALSKRLCRLLGGDISVVSIPDAGSTFLIALPMVLEVSALLL